MELKGKARKIGGEAPAIRVKFANGEQNVIGMMSPKIQILLSLKELNSESELFLSTLASKYVSSEKVVIYFITPLEKKLDIENINITLDEEMEFGKKFGVLLPDESGFANAVFVIDAEGEIIYLDTSSEKLPSVEKVVEGVDSILNRKKRGHSHENWMRA